MAEISDRQMWEIVGEHKVQGEIARSGNMFILRVFVNDKRALQFRNHDPELLRAMVRQLVLAAEVLGS